MARLDLIIVGTGIIHISTKSLKDFAMGGLK